MRLLHTKRLKFEEFFDDKTPEYSVLSHRWTVREVSYEQFLAGETKDGYGYEKVQKLCEISAADGFTWTWIDTCCIDKRSSAELSEAINSMFWWYVRAARCYVFLPDVHACDSDADGAADGSLGAADILHAPAGFEPVVTGAFEKLALQSKSTTLRHSGISLGIVPDKEKAPVGLSTRSVPSGSRASYSRDTPRRKICCDYLEERFWEDQFRDSVWFKRGWTLQELLAPRKLIFFNSAFRMIGDRDTLSDIISDVSGIDVEIFQAPDAWQSHYNRYRSRKEMLCSEDILGGQPPDIEG